MKIAFVTQPWDIIVPAFGGSTSIPIIAYQLAARLAKRHAVTLYGRQDARQPLMEQDDLGITYRRISLKKEDLLLKPFKFLDRIAGRRLANRPLFNAGFYYQGYARQIAQELGRSKYDIIHVYNFSQFAPIMRRYNPDSKIVLHMHCEWLTQLDAGQIAQRLEAVDLILGCSPHITGKIQARFPQYAARARTLFNGVDTRNFTGNTTPDKAAPRTILFSGRISPEKGIHVLLDAFTRIARTFPRVRLVLVGMAAAAPLRFIVGLSDEKPVQELQRFYTGEPYLAQLQRRIPPELQDRVFFAGFTPHAEVARYYRQADILVNPSLSEAFGMSLIEAMSAGLPVVATRAGGMVDIVVDGQTGFLVPPDDATALAQAVLALLQDDNLRRAMGQTGRERAVACFDWDIIAENLDAFYQTLAAPDGRPLYPVA